ncbi:MAG TPA: hypothetical protein VFY93_15005, partial [Planctomycetota bacterium]|nr:hypothetical protein [Planctomycetota bacterium]
SVQVTDSLGMSLDGYGLRVGPGHHAVDIERHRDPQTGAMVTTGLTDPAPGHGRGREDVRFLRDMQGGGPITVEAFRHGYEPARVFAYLSAGEVTTVRVVLVESPDADWRPKVDWGGVAGAK